MSKTCKRDVRGETGEGSRHPASTELTRSCLKGSHHPNMDETVQGRWAPLKQSDYSKWNGDFGELLQRGGGPAPIWVSQSGCYTESRLGRQVQWSNLCVSLTRIRNAQIAWNASCLIMRVMAFPEISVCVDAPSDKDLLPPVWVGLIHAAVAEVNKKIAKNELALLIWARISVHSFRHWSCLTVGFWT